MAVQGPAQHSGRRWWALIAIAASVLVVGLDLTVLNLALPTIATDLHASTSDLQWISDAYSLVLAAAILPAGLLGDRYGRRKVLLIALVVFGFSSAACAYAASTGELIAARAVLGIGAAAVFPLSLSVLPVLFAPEERQKAIAIMASATFISFPIGPIVGGYLLDHLWWGSVFLINVPVVVLAVLAVTFLLPESRSERRPSIDIPGVLLSSLGLTGVTYGCIKAGESGWSNATALVTIAAGAVLLVAFTGWERRLTARTGKGSQGAQGAQGAQGIQGLNGDQWTQEDQEVQRSHRVHRGHRGQEVHGGHRGNGGPRGHSGPEGHGGPRGNRDPEGHGGHGGHGGQGVRPLVELGLFRSASFTWGTILATMVTFALFGLFFAMPQFFQEVQGTNAMGSGLRLLPMIGGMLIGMVGGTRLQTERKSADGGTRPPLINAKAIATAGFVVMTAAMAIGATTSVTSGTGFAAAWIALAGLGVGLSMPTAMNAALSALSAERSGSGSALVSAMRQVGATIGVAVLGTVLSTGYSGRLDVTGFPPAVATTAKNGVVAGVHVAHQLGSAALLDAVRTAFVHGMDIMLWACAGIALASAVIALIFLPRRPGGADAAGQAVTSPDLKAELGV